MRGLILLLLVLLTGLQYKLWLGDNSVWQWHELRQQITQQKSVNLKLLNINKSIAADIAELKSGEQALEERARFELGMVRNSETYYQFVD